MSVVELHPLEQRLIRTVAEENGFKNGRIEVIESAKKGDNYLGVIHSVRVTEDNKGKVLGFILKRVPLSEQLRRVLPLRRAYEREVFMYETVLPTLRELQVEKSIRNPFKEFAKYYGSSLEESKEFVLMEDLKERGYQVWERRKPMDSQHVKLTITQYARFHAASMALFKLQPNKFKELSGQLMNIFESQPAKDEIFRDNLFREIFATIGENEKLIGPLERFSGECGDMFTSMSNDKTALLHSDCWCNNILFKYKEDVPTTACFIDWQMACMGAPATDLAYFLCVNGSKPIFQNHKEYLKLYYDVLAENLKEFGCDPQEVLSWDSFMGQWKKYAKYGVIVAPMLLKALLSDEEDVPREFEEDKSLADMVQFTGEKQREYKRRLVDVFEFLVDNGLL